MKKIGIILLAVVLNSFVAQAADMTCGGKSLITNRVFTMTIPDVLTHPLSIKWVDSKEKKEIDPSVEVTQSYNIKTVLSRDIQRAEELSKCDPDSFADNDDDARNTTRRSLMWNCIYRDNKESKDKSTDMLLMNLTELKNYQNNPVLNDLKKIDMDFSKVASGRILPFYKVRGMGLTGIYEYFDASGVLLGRYLWMNAELMSCK